MAANPMEFYNSPVPAAASTVAPEKQLAQLLQAGQYDQAFQLAAQTGQMGLLIDPNQLGKLVPGGMNQQQTDAFVKAFAPYEAKIAGTADAQGHTLGGGEGYNVWAKSGDIQAREDLAWKEMQSGHNYQKQYGANYSPLNNARQNIANAKASDDISGKGGKPSPLKTNNSTNYNVPSLQDAFVERHGDGFWNNYGAAVSAELMVLAPAAAEYLGGAAGAAGGASGEASAGVSPLAGAGGGLYDTSGLMASTGELAPGVVSDSAIAASGASSLADVTVTASSLAAPTLSTAGAVGAGIGEVGAGALASSLGGVTPVDYSTAFSKPTTISDYLPKNVVSNYLNEHGVPSYLSKPIGGAVQGSLTSAATGGDPLKGAVGGGLGTAVGQGIGATGVGNEVSSAVGGGTAGDIASGAVTGGLGSGITTAALGGDFAKGAVGGAIGGAGGAAGGDLSKSLGLGSGIGAAAGSYLAGSVAKPSGGSMPSSSTPAGIGLPAGASLPGSDPHNWLTGLNPANNPSLPAGMSGPGSLSTGGTGAGPTTSAAGDTSAAAASTTLGQDIMGFLSSNGGLMTETALALYEANQQKNQNSALSQQLQKIGQPMVDASGQQLKAAQNGTLNAQQQNLQNSQISHGNTLVGEAGPLLNIANTGFQQYQAGALPQWQQEQLDQQKNDAMAQMKQMLGSQVDSTSMLGITNQINTQFDIAKGQMMMQNLGVAEQAFTQGITTQNMGYADIQAGWQTGVEAIQTAFTNAVSMLGAGAGPIEQAIQLAIQGDTQITAALAEMMGTIGMGYAMNNAGNKPGSKSSSGSNILDKLLGAIVKAIGGGNSTVDPFGAGSGYTAPDYSSSMPTTADFQNIDPVQIDVPQVTVDTTGG